MHEPDNRYRLYIRLGKNKRDRRLADFIAEDIARGENVSRLVKDLLYNYYTGAPMPGHTRAAPPAKNEDVRQQTLSSKLKKLNFSGLG